MRLLNGVAMSCSGGSAARSFSLSAQRNTHSAVSSLLEKW